MRSKIYHLGFTSKQKANIKKQIGKRKTSDNQSQSSQIVHSPHVDKYDSYVTLKSEMLGRLLKKKDNNRSTMSYSRFTVSKQSQIMNSLKHESPSTILTTLKEQKDIIYEQRDLLLQIVEANLIKLTHKNNQLVQMQSSRRNQINFEINILLKMIDELQERSRSYDVHQYNLYIYSDILSRYKKDNKVVIAKNNTKTSNKKINRESMLLQSFKKNMEEDDNHFTLKYSEQSTFKERSPRNQPLAEEWDSFRNNLRTTLFKSANRRLSEKTIPPEDEYFTAIKTELVSPISSQKNFIINEYNQSCKVLSQFENVLQEIIEQVACEKVSRDEQFKQMQKQNNEDLLQLSSLISKMKMDEMSERFSFEQKMQQIQQSVSEQLTEQNQARKGEQKAMMRMMLEVVQFFN